MTGRDPRKIVTIRRAPPNHIPALHLLHQQLDDIHIVVKRDVVPLHEQAPRITANTRLQIDDDPVLVAIASDDQGVGSARIRIVHLVTHFSFSTVPEVEDLAVLGGVRGRDFGKRYMAAE